MIVEMKDVKKMEIHEKIYATIECRTKKDFEDIREAVDKQRPKKPNKTRWHGTMLNYCPGCGKGISSESIIYCNHCGQKIDWTGVEE